MVAPYKSNRKLTPSPCQTKPKKKKKKSKGKKNQVNQKRVSERNQHFSEFKKKNIPCSIKNGMPKRRMDQIDLLSTLRGERHSSWPNNNNCQARMERKGTRLQHNFTALPYDISWKITPNFISRYKQCGSLDFERRADSIDSSGNFFEDEGNLRIKWPSSFN